ncbi:MAG: hypothetical protein AAF903_12460 [Pseudomonadota bacterium]
MGDQSRLLSDGLQPYKMVAPELQNVTATTLGGAALMTDFGQISPIQDAGTPFECRQKQITIRTALKSEQKSDECLTGLSQVDEDRRRPPALYVFDKCGTVIHRIDITHSDDAIILAASCASFHEWKGAPRLLETENRTASGQNNVVPLRPYLKMRNSWADMGLSDHLDHIIGDGGFQRAKSLRHLSACKARQTKPAVIAHVFKYFIQNDISFTRIVPRCGLLQAHCGRLDYMEMEEQLLFLYSSHATMVVDLGELDQLWITRHKTTAQPQLMLELYDKGGQCLAALCCDAERPEYEQVNWSLLVNSLPHLD